jgi:hypothetical protein
MRQRIRVRERLPVWGLRLILGVILLTLSELVMWQNPPAHRLLDWPVLLILYVALAAILLDLTVRFQARGPATLLLVSGVYGLVSAAIINHGAFDNLPYSLIVRGMGLQTGAGLWGSRHRRAVGHLGTLVSAAHGCELGIGPHRNSDSLHSARPGDHRHFAGGCRASLPCLP